jgi:hypothetical protein
MSVRERFPSGAPEPWLKLEHVPDPPRRPHVRECVCGHLEGDHASNRAGLAGTLRFGVCLLPGCECREFRGK